MEKDTIKSVIIEHVHIDGIWNKFTVDFILDKDVNILVGDNGVGKTTILNIMAQISNNTINETPRLAQSFTSAEIEYSDGYKAIVKTTTEGTKSISWLHQGTPVKYDDVYMLLDVVSTFDNSKYPESIASKIKAVHSDAESELDIMAYQQIDLLYKYVAMLSKLSRKLTQEGKAEMAEAIYSQYDRMKKFCNELFSDKTWHEDDEDGTIMFQSNDDKDVLKLTQLSSGEKQILILLISTLVQNGRNVITFWDEPEISLHIAWQQVLISIMRELNPNMQIIMATHSPSILHDGWEMRPINVNSIKTRG